MISSSSLDPAAAAQRRAGVGHESARALKAGRQSTEPVVGIRRRAWIRPSTLVDHTGVAVETLARLVKTSSALHGGGESTRWTTAARVSAVLCTLMHSPEPGLKKARTIDYEEPFNGFPLRYGTVNNLIRLWAILPEDRLGADTVGRSGEQNGESVRAIAIPSVYSANRTPCRCPRA
ncbi:hypothetical protein BP6252_02347 [Coleophoma cylindrospora]|uniref:Uncharacterized protein n=1 Tax=Coleophoma cylindrospora TaxID=1849047 RepID=A0A3D8SEI0_9HELO|nr:hypothetical protein BP6252_02347 [Coleophoma cylindrospora]